MRETYTLEVGKVSETVTVQGGALLVSTASKQRETLESIKVMELPLSHRNVTAILALSTGVDVGGGSVRINGMGKSGAVITVEGTDANANLSEGRAREQYGGRNYFDVMSIDAVEEVQLLRGILPAEYGGAISAEPWAALCCETRCSSSVPLRAIGGRASPDCRLDLPTALPDQLGKPRSPPCSGRLAGFRYHRGAKR